MFVEIFEFCLVTQSLEVSSLSVIILFTSSHFFFYIDGFNITKLVKMCKSHLYVTSIPAKIREGPFVRMIQFTRCLTLNYKVQMYSLPDNKSSRFNLKYFPCIYLIYCYPCFPSKAAIFDGNIYVQSPPYISERNTIASSISSLLGE
jgi:hypothetical protein